MIRIADVSDIDQITDIHRQLTQFHCELDSKTFKMPEDEFFSEHLFSAVGSDNREIFVYEEGNEIKGYALVTKSIRELPIKITKKVCLIDQLSVDKKYRHEGIGTKLLEHIKAYVKDNDFDVLEICVRAENKNAYRLYEKMGFEPQLITMEIKLK